MDSDQWMYDFEWVLGMAHKWVWCDLWNSATKDNKINIWFKDFEEFSFDSPLNVTSFSK